MEFLEIVRFGEEQINGVFDTDVYEWVVQAFEPLIESWRLQCHRFTQILK